MSKVKACIFDLDGTLIDSVKMWDEVDRIFFERHNLVYDEEAKKGVQSTFDEAITFLIERYGMSESREEIRREFDELVIDEYKYNIDLKPGVKDFLDYLNDKNIKFCIATSCDVENANNVLSRLGILDMFEFMLTSEELNTTKKEPFIYLECAKKLGYEPEEIVVFEDMYSTLKVAKDAGFITCGINEDANGSEAQNFHEVSDKAIDDFKELLMEVE